MRRLLMKSLIKESTMQDDYNSDLYPGLELTEKGWNWIEANEALFVLHRVTKDEEEIPFQSAILHHIIFRYLVLEKSKKISESVPTITKYRYKC
jgi:hypothetical protein